MIYFYFSADRNILDLCGQNINMDAPYSLWICSLLILTGKDVFFYKHIILFVKYKDVMGPLGRPC